MAAAAILISSAPASEGLNSSAPSSGVNAGAGVRGGHLTLDGRPFFPVMAINQCTAANAERASRLGINLILNESCPQVSARRQLSAIEPYSLAALPIGNRGPQGRALVGWAFPDEPEDNGWTPERLQHYAAFARGSRDGLLSFITMTAKFYDGSASQAVDRRFVRLADVAGFDLYPLGVHCSADLSSVYDSQRKFIALAGATPTFQWIETGAIRPGYCGGFNMTAAELNAEVWLAI